MAARDSYGVFVESVFANSVPQGRARDPEQASRRTDLVARPFECLFRERSVECFEIDAFGGQRPQFALRRGGLAVERLSDTVEDAEVGRGELVAAADDDRTFYGVAQFTDVAAPDSRREVANRFP